MPICMSPWQLRWDAKRTRLPVRGSGTGGNTGSDLGGEEMEMAVVQGLLLHHLYQTVVRGLLLHHLYQTVVQGLLLHHLYLVFCFLEVYIFMINQMKQL